MTQRFYVKIDTCADTENSKIFQLNFAGFPFLSCKTLSKRYPILQLKILLFLYLFRRNYVF